MAKMLVAAVVLSTTFAVPAFAETIRVRGSDCNRLVQQHKPGGADYVLGVDVRGKPVVSADVGGGPALKLPESIDIQIGVDLADRLARRDAKKSPPPTPSADLQRKVMPFEGKGALGTLTIKGNEAYWNGERMLPQDQVALAEACGQAMTGSQGETLPTRKPIADPAPKP